MKHIVVAAFCMATDIVCFHDVCLMLARVEGAHQVERGARVSHRVGLRVSHLLLLTG
jgi:hypothetical protein